ncbi:MAG: ArsR/SmtB family transcription factor [Blautia sp.]
MAKVKDYDLEDIGDLCNLGKAISSPVRLEILQLLCDGESLIIGEIARKMDLPASSTAFHLKILEQAGLIRMEEQPGTRGLTKLCTRRLDRVAIDFLMQKEHVNGIFSVEMPVGCYSSCQVSPTCGLYTKEGLIGNEDMEYVFYYPQRVKAGLLWTSSGYVEYRFANGVPKKRTAKQISVSMEICSEAPGYREDWKSDITVWMNGKDCGTWTCPGDFGARRGRLMSSDYPNGSSQYGLLMEWMVTGEGGFINGEKASDVTIKALHLEEQPFIVVRIGNRPDAHYVGGFNLYGKNFGDYNQDIIMTIEY